MAAGLDRRDSKIPSQNLPEGDTSVPGRFSPELYNSRRFE